MSKIILGRHGRTAWHAEGRYAGTADVPLDDHGRSQAKLVAAHLKSQPVDVVYSSPLSRCLELAEEVAEVHGLEVRVDARLREIDLGRWDGETYQAIVEQDGEILRQWTEDPTAVTVPGGESLIHVQERSMEWFHDAATAFPDGTVFASSHGGPVRTMLASILGLPLGHIFRLTVDLASVSAVNYKGAFSNLEYLNERCYLGDLR